MTSFALSLRSFGLPGFAQIAKAGIESIPVAELPLLSAMTQGSYPGTSPVTATLLNSRMTDQQLILRAGLHFTSIIAGSCCADDPSTPCELPEYCEVEIRVERDTGHYCIELKTR